MSSKNSAPNGTTAPTSSPLKSPNSPLGPSPSVAMQVNVVKPLEDSDYEYAKNLCDDQRVDHWRLEYEKKATRVWTSSSSTLSPSAGNGENVKNGATGGNSALQIIKARTEFPDVSADLLYDVLHDPDYRHKWDKYMLRQDAIGYVNPNTDVCYYALGALPPFRSRDFVVQRSWLDTGAEKFIMAHSVWHNDFAPTQAHVRGVVYLTVYFVRALSGGGCQFTYLTHSNPKGKLPCWLVNRVTTIVAPKLLKKLHKACLKYPEWKMRHSSTGGNNSRWSPTALAVNPVPWRNIVYETDYRRLNLTHCVPSLQQQQSTSSDDLGLLDETAVSERELLKTVSATD